jgi:hypothetical protein
MLDQDSQLSMLNWHYTTAGLTLDWNDIQTREYQNGHLLLRPLLVANPKTLPIPAWEWRTWDVFLNQIKDFRLGKLAHNKLKDLQQAMREGSREVHQFTTAYGKLPDLSIPDLAPARETGWQEDQCVYFDALEANDLFMYPKEVQGA